MIREKIISGNIYHVLNRGVDKREIFLNNEDKYRFIHDLFEFNNVNPINNLTRRFRDDLKASGRPYINENSKNRELLVEILAFCLMPNHYHLLIRPRVDDGLLKFMQRLNMGYAHYFNQKYERKGALFEGRYKSVPIIEESHFIHIPYYIHLNPLDLVAPEWRQRDINNYKEAIEFLDNYRWSSHLDYMGIKNFPSITSRNFLLKIFNGSDGYKKETEEWLKNLEISQIKEIILD